MTALSGVGTSGAGGGEGTPSGVMSNKLRAGDAGGD